MDNTLTVSGQICKCFLAVDGEKLADVRQKVSVTFQLFCGFEAFPLSYIKRNFEGGLIHARLARIKALATAGVGKSLPFRQRTYLWTVEEKQALGSICRSRETAIDGDEMSQSIGDPRIED